MRIPDQPLKKPREAAKKIKQAVADRKGELLGVASAAEKLVAHTVADRLLQDRIKRLDVGSILLSSLRMGSLSLRWNLMTDLAGAIDRLLETTRPVEASVEESVEETVEETVETAEEAVPVTEEIPVEPIALEEPLSIPTLAEVEETDDEDEDEDDEGSSLFGLDTADLEFIDVMDYPELYAEYLARERAGEVRLVHRYRRSFRSRLIQAQGNVKEYYAILKNALLSYKGVKDRLSWDYESYNKGRVKVAKLNAKKKTLYLYLALDPAALVDTKYHFDDVSSKKKYAAVPVLFKIKGERKLKQALELIEMLCGGQLALPPVKNFVPVAYEIPHQDTAALVQEGHIKQLTAVVSLDAPVVETPTIG